MYCTSGSKGKHLVVKEAVNTASGAAQLTMKTIRYNGKVVKSLCGQHVVGSSTIYHLKKQKINLSSFIVVAVL